MDRRSGRLFFDFQRVDRHKITRNDQVHHHTPHQKQVKEPDGFIKGQPHHFRHKRKGQPKGSGGLPEGLFDESLHIDVIVSPCQKVVMKSVFVWINGRILNAKKAKISIDNSSFLSGIGVFETMKAVGDDVLFLPLHLERFFKNAKKTGLKLPCPPDLLFQAIPAIVRKNRFPRTTIRMTLSRDGQGKPHLVIAPRPFEAYPKSHYTRGGKLVFIRSVAADSPALSTIKTTSYLTKMAAREETKRRGAVEGLLINAKGFVTEGASSNVFIVKNGVLITPPLSDGLLPGTRRKLVLRIAKKMKMKSREKSLRPRDILEADEVFITSSLKDILPIRRVEGKTLPVPCPGPVTRELVGAELKQLGSNLMPKDF